MARGGTGHGWVSPLPRPVTDTDASGLHFWGPFSPRSHCLITVNCHDFRYHKSVTVYPSLLNVTLMMADIVIPNLLCPKLSLSSAPCPRLSVFSHRQNQFQLMTITPFPSQDPNLESHLDSLGPCCSGLRIQQSLYRSLPTTAIHHPVLLSIRLTSRQRQV